LLCEPHPGFHESIENNRDCDFDKRCVSINSGETIEFLLVSNPELSTIKSYSDSDLHSQSRSENSPYLVRTVSLDDLVRERFDKREIFYLSADTEGSEYEILKAFSFDEFNIGIITVEHNYNPQREKIFALLTRHGYKRKYEHVSAFDDWYVKS
jgi:FkbM family methyltransferase